MLFQCFLIHDSHSAISRKVEVATYDNSRKYVFDLNELWILLNYQVVFANPTTLNPKYVFCRHCDDFKNGLKDRVVVTVRRVLTGKGVVGFNPSSNQLQIDLRSPAA